MSFLSFRESDFHAAIEHYSIALQHNPQDAKVLSNRAAAYYKLQKWLKCIQVRLISKKINSLLFPRIVIGASFLIQLL